MSSITVRATRWEHGWELELNADQHTQVATLDKARQQVVDYLDTVDPDTDHSQWCVSIAPDLGDLGAEVATARRATQDATAASAAAARQSRAVVRKLRQAGYSVTDSAAILGVSRGRVSQLASPERASVRAR